MMGSDTPTSGSDSIPDSGALPTTRESVDSFTTSVQREQLFDDFESAWKSDHRPSIESYLLQVKDADRVPVLLELLNIEWDQLRHRGEIPNLVEYQARFPQDLFLIASAYRRSSNQPNVARLQPIELLGGGGQGEVWLMFDPQIDRRVALKIVKPSLRGTEPTLSLFRREAEVSGKLEHPNIVPVYDIAAELSESGQFDPNTPCYVMRVVGDPRLHVAIAAFHERPRSTADQELLTSLRAFDKEQSVENRRDLESRLAEFSFDPQQPCDETLKTAVVSILKKDSEAGTLAKAITKFHSGKWSETLLRKLLNRFLRICEGVAYAHSRGVIHCDLKPANIMLGEYGETLIIDWGLAKVLGDAQQSVSHAEGPIRVSKTVADLHQSLQADFLGTPGYTSPEQAMGKTDQLSPATDIFSLGAILYHILAGQPTFKISAEHRESVIEESRRIINEANFPRPTEVNSNVPKPLEAIVDKAMSLNPLDRYTTVFGLAADVEQWLNEEPVSVWPEPMIIRVRRWVKRHQTAVSSAAAALLVAVVFASVFATVVSSKNATLAAVNGNLKDANRALNDSNTALNLSNASLNDANQALENKNDELIAANEKVRQAVDDAKQQSQLTSETLRDVVLEVDPILRNLTGMSQPRTKVMSRIVPRLQSLTNRYLAQKDQGRTELYSMRAIADLMQQMGSTEAGSDSGLAEKDANWLKSSRDIVAHTVDLAERLSRELPDSMIAKRDLMLANNSLADVCLRYGDTKKAESLLELTRQSATELLESAGSDDVVAHRDIALVLERSGVISEQLGQIDKALKYYLQSKAHLEPWAARLPPEDDLQRDFAIALGHVAAMQLRQRHLVESKVAFEDALKIHQYRSVALPADSKAQRDLALAYDSLAQVNILQNHLPEAAEQTERAVSILELLTKQDPLHLELSRSLATLLGHLGDVFLQQKNLAQAEENYRRAFSLREKLSSQAPGHLALHRELIVSSIGLGDLLLQQNKITEATELYERAYELATQLASAIQSPDADLVRTLVVSFNKLGRINLINDREDQALVWYEKGLAFSERLAAKNPDDRRAERDRELALCNVADTRQQAGDFEVALEIYQELYTKARERAKTAQDFETQSDLYSVSSRLGASATIAGRFDVAHNAFSESLSVIARFRMQRDSPGLQVAEAKVQWQLGLMFKMVPDLAASRRRFEASQQLLGKMLEQKKLPPSDAKMLPLLEEELKSVDQIEFAISDIAKILELPEEMQVELLTIRSVELARRGKIEDSERAGEMVLAKTPLSAETYYELARADGLILSMLKNQGNTDPEATKKYLDRAIERLKTCVAMGFNNFKLMKMDLPMHGLRKEPEFIALIEELKTRPKP